MKPGTEGPTVGPRPRHRAEEDVTPLGEEGDPLFRPANMAEWRWEDSFLLFLILGFFWTTLLLFAIITLLVEVA